MNRWLPNILRRDLKPSEFTDSCENLKILIISTPKTGNTWLKYLLAAVYDLPIVGPSISFDEMEMERFGSRWIAHQHYSPRSNLVDWAERNRVVLLTTVRHPGDVLISLYHFIRSQGGEKFGPGVDLLLADTEQIGAHTLTYVKEYFYTVLHGSIEWIHREKSRIIRYEDLWRDPIETLRHVTDNICAVSNDCIERAVEQSSLDVLRSIHSTNAKFFRQGGIGKWRQVLPADIIDCFQTLDPYPAQFAALGYTLDPHDPLIDAPAKSRPIQNPFHNITHFDNGVSVPIVAVRIYLSFASTEAIRRWPDVTNTQLSTSFYAWLNGTADEDTTPNVTPLTTNLATYLHHHRYDLLASFPDIFGQNRIDWAWWFVRNAQAEFNLEDAFIEPIRTSMLSWANTILSENLSEGDLPPITNLCAYIYEKREDLRQAYPNLAGNDRVSFLIWFLRHARHEYNLTPEFVQTTHLLFMTWANAPEPDDPFQHERLPTITRFAAHIYRKRLDLQQMYPDLYGRHRLDYLMQFTSEYTWLPESHRAVYESWARICLDKPTDSPNRIV